MSAPAAERQIEDDIEPFDALIAMARADFMCFVEMTFNVLHPGSNLVYADYLQVLADLLMRVEEGRYRRVNINLPPRQMKSMMVSVFYVAWRLGRNPASKFIAISYGDDLAHDLSVMTRTLMLSPIYGQIFPETVLDKKSEDHIRTTQKGGRYATAVGSDITGFGADLIIVDDPIQADDAGSEHVKARVRDWMSNSVSTRFNDQAKGALILVMHRLAPDDLSATLEPNADFVLKLPMIAEKEEKYERHGKLTMHRRPGDVLNPARMTAEEVAKLKASLPRHVWDGQYQQRPTAGGSGMLSVERFQRYDLSKPPKFELSIHSWDVGATIGGNASVCTKWGLAANKDNKDALYLTQVISVKLELPEVLATIKSEIERDRPALVVIDERGVGLGVAQHLRRAGYRNISSSTATSAPITPGAASKCRPSDTKIERFGRAILRIDEGEVLIPMSATFLDKFLYEASAFPNISDDDQVDSMTQVIANFENAVREARRLLRNGLT
ncbi:hypothetical protein [Hyphomicrobium sp. MC1]|uniref:hypothetical protein n=1 Tax=Hyphomicrobium sp. (strain MC1) TaxID=717785 RepID=UPI0002E78E0A|nr:hypothetical protein [Hyphomicrobium sp. MC1]